MPRYTQKEVECRVFTFKEGLLSKVAHDLELDVGDLELEWDDARTSLSARFGARSLKVLHPMHDGRPNPSALSDRDKHKIEETIQGEVLHTSRWPDIRFRSSAIELTGESAATIRGTLELCGKSRELTAHARREGGRWITELTLHQPDYGITPYSAMLGTLRIQKDVRVRLSVPA